MPFSKPNDREKAYEVFIFFSSKTNNCFYSPNYTHHHRRRSRRRHLHSPLASCVYKQQVAIYVRLQIENRLHGKLCVCVL